MFFLSPAGAQKQWELRLLPVDQSPEWLAGRVKIQERFPDSVRLLDALQGLILDLHGQAFLEASADTLVWRDSQVVAFLHIGKPYRWAILRNGNVPEVFLDQSGYRERLYRNRPFSYQKVRRLQESLLSYAENNGYPFARVRLDSLQLSDHQLSAQLFFDPGPLISIEDLIVTGEVRIGKAFLANYLGLHSGDAYDRSRVLRIRDRLRELPFLSARSDPRIEFRGERATIRLDLERKRASRFDFLIGVLPNSRQAGRLLITGDFNGELYNQFGLGERIFAEFEQLRPQTQRLQLAFNYPYFLNLPFGLDLAFNLYKRDTNFLDLEYDLGLQYLLEGGNYLKGFWNNQTSTLLTVDTAAILRSGRLPDTLDVSRSFFGLEYAFQRLDYRFNPRRGWAAFLRAGAGIRRVRPSNLIRGLPVEDLYAGLDLKSNQYRLQARLEAYLPLFSRSTLKGGLQGGYLITGQPVYANEQFRIGGARLLRGFDEELIFATNYTVLTLEYRLLLGQNSYLYAFADYARVDERTAKSPSGADTVDFPYGFGAGITFETRAGLFGISLALGSQKGNPIDPGAPKVHFGYVSLF